VPGSPYTDLDRPPLSRDALSRALVVPGGLWTKLDLRTETGSTNADVAAAARAGAAEGLVVVAERQTAGRGRLGRVWQSPARAGLAVSVLLRPVRAAAVHHGWLPLLVGVAAVEAVAKVARAEASLKWPNDLLIGGRKLAGILAEAVPGPRGQPEESAVVVGIGLNVTVRADELPGPEATSLLLAGAESTDRDPLLRELLRGLARWYERWRDAAGDPEVSGLRRAYLDRCDTVGQDVRVMLPDGQDLVGEAATVDEVGRLVVIDLDGTRQVVAAGDVVHLRPNFDS